MAPSQSRKARNERYTELYSAAINAARKRARDARSDEQKKNDRENQRASKQAKRDKRTSKQKAVDVQKSKEGMQRHKAGLDDSQQKELLQRMRATSKRIYEAKRHGPKRFVADRAARYPLDSKQHHNYGQLADPGFVVLPGVCKNHTEWLKTAQQIVETWEGQKLFFRAHK